MSRGIHARTRFNFNVGSTLSILGTQGNDLSATNFPYPEEPVCLKRVASLIICRIYTDNLPPKPLIGMPTFVHDLRNSVENNRVLCIIFLGCASEKCAKRKRQSDHHHSTKLILVNSVMQSSHKLLLAQHANLPISPARLNVIPHLNVTFSSFSLNNPYNLLTFLS